MTRLLLSFHLVTARRLKMASIPVGTSLTKWVNEAICQRLDRDQPHTILDESQMAQALQDIRAAKRTRCVHPGIPMPLPDRTPIDPQANLRAAIRRERGVYYVGAYSLYYKDTAVYACAAKKHKKLGSDSPGIEALIEDACITDNFGVLSAEQQRDILANHAEKQKELAKLPPVPDHLLGHPKLIDKWRDAGSPVEAPPRIPGTPREEEIKDTAEYLAMFPTSAEEQSPLVNTRASAPESDADFDFDEDSYAKIKKKAGGRV